MTDTLLTEAVKQAPSLGVLCFIVVVFLKHMTRRDDMIKDIHRENTDERRLLREVLKDNTKAMADNTRELQVLADVIKNGGKQ